MMMRRNHIPFCDSHLVHAAILNGTFYMLGVLLCGYIMLHLQSFNLTEPINGEAARMLG